MLILIHKIDHNTAQLTFSTKQKSKLILVSVYSLSLFILLTRKTTLGTSYFIRHKGWSNLCSWLPQSAFADAKILLSGLNIFIWFLVFVQKYN